eukprot:CAMPEP_0198566766 /NCGR_PEP_ID=MMETSP1462-20131121/103788_1 /TAXON_ID=1333877 /ORGANISM="Brandtodinium nutriculum, Strain RCC3387" /LENGTH=51 /DNA_ID=CAMNT_0044297803 /DNA_START=433 /DNA_END=585 /DNA_ORIENTATION=+
MTTATVVMVRTSDFSRMRNFIMEKHLRENNGAMARLLDLMNDVVVQLDADL